MRKFMISVLMITLLLPAGCGEREARMEEDFEAFRAAITVTEMLALRAELTALGDGTAAEYVLDTVYDGSAVTVTVAEPTLLAGVTAVAARGETELSYEGVRLGLGPVDGEGLTPVSAIPAMIDAMQSGYLELLWREAPYLVARVHVGEGTVMTLWLEERTLTPAAAELASGGKTVITCRFSGWTMA